MGGRLRTGRPEAVVWPLTYGGRKHLGSGSNTCRAYPCAGLSQEDNSNLRIIRVTGAGGIQCQRVITHLFARTTDRRYRLDSSLPRRSLKGTGGAVSMAYGI